MPLIKNLKGVFWGSGFAKKQGCHINLDDADFCKGPCDIAWDKDAKLCDPSHATGPIYDGSGLIATAGFVDSHTHSLFAGDRSFEYAMRVNGASYTEIAAQGGGILLTQEHSAKASDLALKTRLRQRLQSLLSFGSCVVEMKSGYAATAQEELRHLRLMKAATTEVESGSLPRTYKSFLGLHALPKNKSEAEYVSEMKNILPTVVKDKLADFVDAFPEKGFFSLKVSLDFVESAIALGLKAKVHADEITDMDAAHNFARLGALSVDHLQKISQRGVEALKESGTVATLLPATSFYLKLAYADARRLIDSGLKVALATDYNPGTAPNPSLLFSALLAIYEYKMTASEILCALTFNGAQAMGIQDSCGSLQFGKDAHINLWNLESSPQKAEHLLHEIFIKQERPTMTFVSGKRCRPAVAPIK